MARRFRSANAVRRRTPNRAWGGQAPAAYVTVPAASKVVLGGFTLSNANIDETVLRTVGQISVKSDQVTADEVQIGSFGLITASDAAVAVGVTAIPGPSTDREDDGWFVYIPFAFSLEFGTGVGIAPDLAHRIEFDSKAKRIVQEGRQIVIMVENIHATHGFEILQSFRLLSMVRGTG